MIREARKFGALREGQTVVELTSGNTGTGLAIVCAVLWSVTSLLTYAQARRLAGPVTSVTLAGEMAY